MTNVGSSVARVNRSLAAMKSTKDSTDTEKQANSKKPGEVTLHELDEHEAGEATTTDGGQEITLDDNSSNLQSNKPLANGGFQQRTTTVLPPVQQHKSIPTSGDKNFQQRWGKNIEEGISGILKKLDQLTSSQDTHGIVRRPITCFALRMHFPP